MKRLILLLSIATFCFAQEAKIVDHNQLVSFGHNGNNLKGIATPSLGATEFEVWKSSIAAGSCTPMHVHETEEIFIFFSGSGKAIVGEKEYIWEAPCTLICPANVPHQIFNTGDEPSEQIAIIGLKSKIRTMDGNVMNLPWRN